MDSSESFGHLLTVDVGGSHVSAALCALDDLRVLQLTSAPLTGICSFDGFVDLIYLLGREVIGPPRRVAGVSLAVPGPFDCQAGISLMKHKLEWLYERDLRGALAARFGWNPCQIRFLNDASAFLLGEVHAGSARGASRAAGLTLGTGIGSAFSIDGHCVTEGRGVPPQGEIWNYPYRGATVEDLISTRAVKADYAALTGRDVDVQDIASAVSSGDAHARQVFEKLGCNLGQMIRDVIAPFEPEVVVIGGGISRSAQLFLPSARTHVDDLDLHIVPSVLFDQAQLIGAAAYWHVDFLDASKAGRSVLAVAHDPLAAS